MKKIACRVCRSWFEKNESGICSLACLEKKKKEGVFFEAKKLETLKWNEHLKNRAIFALQKRRKRNLAIRTVSQKLASQRKDKTNKMSKAYKTSEQLLERLIKRNEKRPNKDRESRIVSLCKKLGIPSPFFRSHQPKIPNSKVVSSVAPEVFYVSREWRELRYQALKMYGRTCQLCRTTEGRMHVDHIKPRSKYPALSLVLSNLQILCEDCNLGKSNKDETDWRPVSQLPYQESCDIF